MAYPPPVPPATRTNATVMATNHPSDHNLVSAALTEILNHVAALEAGLYPIGTISIWGADLPPGNHELCRGQEVSRSTYPEVFSLVGIRFGAGNGSTTFTMPDMRGRYPIGYNAGGGYFSAGVGERYGSADSTLPSHAHTQSDHWHTVDIWSSYDGLHTHGSPLSSSQGFLSDGFGGGTAGINLGDENAYGITAFTSYPTQTWDGRQDHRHAVNGFTGSNGAIPTQAAGGSATNTNLPPSTSFNYIMRMH